MGLASVILGMVALLFVVGGMFLFCVPPLAAGLGLLAPVVSLIGIVLGGLSLSRARRDGEPTGTSMTGIVLNVLAFIPGLVVALTCGLCNACATASMAGGGDGGMRLSVQDGGIRWRFSPQGSGVGVDAGPGPTGGGGFPPPAPGEWAAPEQERPAEDRAGPAREQAPDGATAPEPPAEPTPAEPTPAEPTPAGRATPPARDTR